MAGPLLGLAGFAGTVAGAKLAQTLEERREKAAREKAMKESPTRGRGYNRAEAPAPPKSPAKGRERPDEGFATNKRLSSFGDAFAKARASGKDVFTWTNPRTGKTESYTTEVKPYKKGGLVTKAPAQRK